MKKIVILFAFVLIPLMPAQAKLIKGYGFKTGIAITNQDFNYTMGWDLDFKNRLGFDFGGYVEWFDLRFFSVLTEVHYLQKGMVNEIAKTDEQGKPAGTEKFSNRVDYLCLPILAKITYQADGISPYFLAGPRFDFLLGYRSHKHLWDHFYDNLKDLDVGIDIGIGAELKLTPEVTLLSEFRFSPDITYAYKTETLKVKNNAFEILAGVRF